MLVPHRDAPSSMCVYLFTGVMREEGLCTGTCDRMSYYFTSVNIDP